MARNLQEIIAEKLENPEFKKEYLRLKAGGPCVDCGKHTLFWCEDCREFCCDPCLIAVYTEPEVEPYDDFLEGTFCSKCAAKYDDSFVKIK